ncbi:hypothetical protein N7492_004057 [Penicillium capsulatum]|uniref:Uncharacterized protein n=1 Tax=Penicillium capsulatum TaxID=69766 RepID=A0A9W9LY14_9EURO|nr:hypothetical protein N7492_004057 [Penicillium capsulatum]KAJ6121369.1 hypothetical protein N7512_003834 [Penicillium capsulatum]
MSSLAPQPCTQYLINCGFWGGSYDILQDGAHLYHVDVSRFTPGKPDLTFHAGPSTSGNVVAVCKYEKFSLDSEIGLGNPGQPLGLQWERLNAHGFMTKRFTFRVGFGSGPPEVFVWKNTHSLGKGITGNMKLMHEQTNTLTAVFSASNGLSGKAGRLEIYGPHAKEFQFMVLITAIAVRERTEGRSGGAAGGGGA